MSIFPPRNFLMTLMTHDIRDIRDISGRPYLGGQHGVSRIARGRFSDSERPFLCETHDVKLLTPLVFGSATFSHCCYTPHSRFTFTSPSHHIYITYTSPLLLSIGEACL